VSGELTSEPQDEALASHAPLIERRHLHIDWGQPALAVARLVRGMAPRPGAFTTIGGKVLRVLEANVQPAPMPPGAVPGTVSILGKRAVVATADGTLELLSAQLEGKKALPAADLINGRVLSEGLVLGAV
jgi:methionyl-tRNA formyltransferase